MSGDPHEAWAWLREHAPVYWNATADGGYWALTRYADVNAVYLDPVTFSSKHGTVFGWLVSQRVRHRVGTDAHLF